MAHENILPRDGQVFYYPDFLSPSESQNLFIKLKEEIAWEHRPIKIFGKEVMQPRLISWHGDQGAQYSYSQLTLDPKPWTTELKVIKEKLQLFTDEVFNSVLLNFYRNGRDSNGWHSDDEPELGSRPTIASVSLGVSRDFIMRHKADHQLKVRLPLLSGSLLIMQGESQEYWQHTLPKRTGVQQGRINLTYRKISL